MGKKIEEKLQKRLNGNAIRHEGQPLGSLIIKISQRSTVPNSPSVLVQPLLLASQEEPGMFDFFHKFPWVLEPVRYTDQAALIAALDEKVIAPAEAKALPSNRNSRTD